MTAVPLVGATYATPFGDLRVLVTPEDDVVRSAGFRTMHDVSAALPTPLVARGWVEGEQPRASAAIAAWLDGDAGALARVEVAQPGGPFLQEVWAQLRTVPSGTTVSYGELATMAGRPRAMRAVGTACGRNAIALFVPCHRVVRSDGTLGEYGYGGPQAKADLLAFEGVSHLART